jgi:hypothetical protein
MRHNGKTERVADKVNHLKEAIVDGNTPMSMSGAPLEILAGGTDT